MRASMVWVFAVIASSVGQAFGNNDLVDQAKVYQRWWNTDLGLKFDDLPTKGSVPASRMPYSGYIYPDSSGGTSNALSRYDRAFNGGRQRATGFERWDTTAFQEMTQVQRRGGLFGLRIVTEMSMQTPHWHGHCNGWTAATIRHAEPQRSVRRNGVVFSPADIKALLAEIYMYSHYEDLAGASSDVTAAGLHATLANWLGRQSHPIAMEGQPGREKWNFPVYAYDSRVVARNSKQVEIKTNMQYLYYSRGEYQQSPKIKRTRYFHYALNLDAEGNISGKGYFYRDSSAVDLLWVPLYPAPGGKKGNERGNPHVKVEEVLAIWRDSVPSETIAQWVNIDPKGESLLPAPERPQVAGGNTEGSTVRANFEQPAGTAAAGSNPPAPAPENAPSAPPSNPPTE